jgi:hypothetical protein
MLCKQSVRRFRVARNPASYSGWPGLNSRFSGLLYRLFFHAFHHQANDGTLPHIRPLSFLCISFQCVVLFTSRSVVRRCVVLATDSVIKITIINSNVSEATEFRVSVPLDPYFEFIDAFRCVIECCPYLCISHENVLFMSAHITRWKITCRLSLSDAWTFHQFYTS